MTNSFNFDLKYITMPNIKTATRFRLLWLKYVYNKVDKKLAEKQEDFGKYNAFIVPLSVIISQDSMLDMMACDGVDIEGSWNPNIPKSPFIPLKIVDDIELDKENE